MLVLVVRHKIKLGRKNSWSINGQSKWNNRLALIAHATLSYINDYENGCSNQCTQQDYMFPGKIGLMWQKKKWRDNYTFY